MDSSEEKSTADEESTKSKNKEEILAIMESAESKDSADDEATKQIDYLEIGTAGTEVATAPSDVSALPATPATAAADHATKKWTPENIHDAPDREEEENPKFLPYDGEANHLCGGDFVFTLEPAMSTESEPSFRRATIAFLFCHDGKKYGMTVGHLKPSCGIGSTLFAFAKSKPWAVKIGRVVSFSLSVDSLIFRLYDDIKADLYKVRLAGDTKHVVDLLRAEVAMNNLRAQGQNGGYRLIGRGAQRRGTKGELSSFWTRKGDPNVHEKDVSSKKISTEGDCGMIIFDANGDPLSMHQADFEIMGDGEIKYESYSVPLTRIIKVHQSFFPNITVSEIDDDLSILQTSPLPRASRPFPQVDASFVAKHRPIIKMQPGVLKLARIPGSGLTPNEFLQLLQRQEDSQRGGETASHP